MTPGRVGKEWEMSQEKEDKLGNICKQIISVATWGSYPTGSSRT